MVLLTVTNRLESHRDNIKKLKLTETMTKQEQLRHEYFIETGIVWIDTNDNIEMDYLKWVENKALILPDVSQQSELLLFDKWLYKNSSSEDKDRESIIDRYLKK